ncbi:MAG: hypothetical protein IK039_06335 [Bacteroidaceae bacterium]|nr:hypothetical protein [Bacteroidaceae bacterium]
MDNGFLPQLKVFLGRYKYWIVLVLFLLVILVTSDYSLVKRMKLKAENRAKLEQLDEFARQKRENEKILEGLNNDTLVGERIAREKYYMHREDEDLFLEQQ